VSTPLRWRALATGTGLAALVLVLRGANFSAIAQLCRGVGPHVGLVLLPQAAGLGLQALALRSLLESLGASLSRRRLATLLLATEAARMALPGGAAAADGLAAVGLRLRLGVALPNALAAVAARKWLLIATNAVYAGLAWFALTRAGAHRAEPKLRLFEHLLLGVTLALTVTSVAMAVGLTQGSLTERLGRQLARLPSARLRGWLLARGDTWRQTDRLLAAPWLRRLAPKLVAPALLHESVWLLETLETWFIARLLGVDLGLGNALSIEVCAGLVRASAFLIPGGLGAQDASYVAMFALFGVEDARTLGAAFVLIKRAKELVFVGLGWSAFALDRRGSSDPFTKPPSPPEATPSSPCVDRSSSSSAAR